MSDLVKRLEKAHKTFPVIEDSPADLFKDAADHIEALEAKLAKVKHVELKNRLAQQENYHRGVRQEIATELREALYGSHEVPNEN
jgi:hypothetical protein